MENLTFSHWTMRSAHIVLWDVDPNDYAGADAGEKVDQIVGEIGKHSVVLLHDGRSESEGQSDAVVTVQVIELLLTATRRMDVGYITVSQAMDGD